MDEKKLTALEMLQKVEDRWLEVRYHEATNHDFSCLMTDVSNFLAEAKKKG